MYIIQEKFIAKPGSAGKLAKLMKEVLASMGDEKGRVLLDFVTDFNTIILQHEVASLTDWEKDMEEYKKNTDPAFAEKMKGYTDLYQTGKREIFKIVD